MNTEMFKLRKELMQSREKLEEMRKEKNALEGEFVALKKVRRTCIYIQFHQPYMLFAIPSSSNETSSNERR